MESSNKLEAMSHANIVSIILYWGLVLQNVIAGKPQVLKQMQLEKL